MPSLIGEVRERWSLRVVEGASLILNGFIATSDALGQFEFRDIPVGTYTLKVLHKNYESFETKIELPTEETYSISTIQLTPVFRIVRG